MALGPPDCHLLSMFGAWVFRAFGHRAYHVGSSLTEKRGWRDVDVRLILPDEEYEAMFGDPSLPPDRADPQRRVAHEFAWTMAGRKLTGLPIDFQIQQQSLANAEFSGPRGALLGRCNNLPGGGD